MGLIDPAEKRESVRAVLRAQIQFSVMDADAYNAVRARAGSEGCVGRGPVHTWIQSHLADAEGGLSGDTAPDLKLAGFLIQMDEKLDRILNMLTKQDLCDDLPVYVGQGLDISGKGMRILSEKAIETGKVLDAKFRISRYPVMLFQVYGRVLRVRSTDRNGIPLYEIALEFLDLDEGYKEWIISYVFQVQREAIRSDKKGGNG
jgi:hypothetical protein